jgi:hypothetical protein
VLPDSPAADVLGLGYWLKVGYLDAPPVEAGRSTGTRLVLVVTQMVKLMASRDGADKKLVRRGVC